jgi:hypothetical protein
MQRSRSGLISILSSVSLLAFVIGGLGATLTSMEHRIYTPPVASQWATTDRWLGVIHAVDPSRAVLEALTDLPSRDMILFVGPDDASSLMQTYYAVSYLSWPRPVAAIGCQDMGNPSIIVQPPKSTRMGGAIYFLLHPPSWLPEGKSVGSELMVVPLSEMREWSSFCP